MKLRRFLASIRDLPKSLFINLSLFPIDIAIKFPIWARYDTKILGKLKRGTVILDGPIYRKMITIGIHGSPGVSNGRRTTLKISENGKVVFQGKAKICRSCLIRIDGGEVVFGEGFSANSNSTIWVNKHITFGKNVLIGYDVYIRDGDGHFIIVDGIRKENTADIIIQDHVWIGAFSKIEKGSTIGRDSVVALNSVVTGLVPANVIVGGMPAKIIQKGTNWSVD